MAQFNQFKFWRMVAGLRQIDVASALGVSESLVAKWETGRVRINEERAEQLGILLGVDPEKLMDNLPVASNQ